MFALLQTLVEEVDRMTMLKWQTEVLDILPSNFDVTLSKREKPSVLKDEPVEHEPRVVISRAGKELFDLSFSRAGNSFIDEVTVHGACIPRRHDYIRLSASKLRTELPWFVRVFDLYRKLNNLYSSSKSVIINSIESGKPGVMITISDKTGVVTISLERTFAATVMTQKGSSFSLNKPAKVGTTTKGEDAIFDLVEKGLK